MRVTNKLPNFSPGRPRAAWEARGKEESCPFPTASSESSKKTIEGNSVDSFVYLVASFGKQLKKLQ